MYARDGNGKQPSRGTVAGEAHGDAYGGPEAVGRRLRAERERQGIGLRELARRVNVSASLISQIELGRATPSVATLYAIVSELHVSLDELFSEEASAGAGGAHGPAPVERRADVGRAADAPAGLPLLDVPGTASGPVVRGGERQSIHLGSGVIWERMSPDTEHGVDFLYVVYEVGGASSQDRALIRHGGREYGHVLEGRLGVTVGFETYELGPGDAISFDSTTPHCLFNAGDVPAKGIWFVVGRDDPRVTRGAGSPDAQR